MTNNFFRELMPRTRSTRHQVVYPGIILIELWDDRFNLLGDKLVRGRHTYLVSHHFQFISLRTQLFYGEVKVMPDSGIHPAGSKDIS